MKSVCVAARGLAVVAGGACVICIACSDSTGGPDAAGEVSNAVAISWVDSAVLPATVEPGGELTMTAVVTVDGEPVADAAVDAETLLGGGTIEPATATSDADGRVSFTWRPGLMPVRAAIRLSVRDEAAFVDHVARIEQVDAIPPVSAAGIEALLANAGIDGSTEGLAFDDAGNLWLAAPGYLVRVRMDGTSSASLVPVGGDGLETPLGMAWDFLRKCLWVADKGSIRRVTLDLDADGGPAASAKAVVGLDGLVTPNSVAIRDNRYVYFSDSCTGNVYRFAPDDDPVGMKVVAEFDLSGKGGPNGLAFDDSGRLWVTTENVGLLCPDSGVDVTAATGGLYVVDIGETLPVPAYGARLERFAMFGDGLAFDRDGNLYVIFDHFDGFNLVSSAVWVLRADQLEPDAASPDTTDDDPVMVASVAIPDGATSPDRLIANIAWGHGDFGADTAWFSLLAVPLVAAERGAMNAEFGIGGRSLLPADLPE